MRELTIGFSVYGQPQMLAYWFEQFLAQPQEWKDRVEIVVVDDCGQPPAEVPDDPGVFLYRIQKDIPWNQGGARNLVAHVAKTDRLMLIDPDMTLGKGMLQKLVEAARQLAPGMVMRPALRHIANKAFDHTSPNVHLLLREDFYKLGGYDEDYCGHKGWSDVQLLRCMQKSCKLSASEDIWFWFHHSSPTIADAQVVTLDRSVAKNKALHIRKMDTLKKKGVAKFVASLGKPLRFEWSKVK